LSKLCESNTTRTESPDEDILAKVLGYTRQFDKDCKDLVVINGNDIIAKLPIDIANQLTANRDIEMFSGSSLSLDNLLKIWQLFLQESKSKSNSVIY
jgi:hypothetical protein